jgi:hypothetical protein
MRRRSYSSDDKVIVSLWVVNRIAHLEPPQAPRGKEHNLTDTADSEPDRHADMAAGKAEPLVEALGIDARVMR